MTPKTALAYPEPPPPTMMPPTPPVAYIPGTTLPVTTALAAGGIGLVAYLLFGGKGVLIAGGAMVAIVVIASGIH